MIRFHYKSARLREFSPFSLCCLPFSTFAFRKRYFLIEPLFSKKIYPFFVQYRKIAGSYPGITRAELEAVSSEPAAEIGQWTYDFSDPDGPQLGTVAIEGSNNVACAIDPVVIIAEHFSLGIELSEVLKDPVDLVVMVDRGVKTFAERKFLVLDDGSHLVIGAFQTKADLPEGYEIVGRVVLTQIPWLPCMQKTKTGFAEVDNYFSN
mmetsp:Transcript_19828/g.29102  ORF Transcript_19828/g.29102 Transcript_19828/m.29102 type:complete len:207 (-) Transcript_19828:269-889(-)